MRRCLAILLFLLVLAPSAAGAHSNEVESNPEDGATIETLPAEATLTFGEPPQTADVVLARPDGRVAKLKAHTVDSTVTVRLPENGPRGAYTLSYRVVSADGHPVSGSSTFTVTTGSAPTPAPEPSPPTTPTNPAQTDEGPLVPIVISIAVLGIAATVLAARSLRR